MRGTRASCPAALLLAGPGGKEVFCRPDKALMPPSGTTAGTAPDRPAALRLPGLRGRRFSVGRIKHLCRHPALPRVRRLTARRRCACRAWGEGGFL
ncbi:hypothetical protein CWM59_28030 [Klebsiella sp. B-Nf7]|nr:hypothetical protein CWM59_28030 [Klebsiella sp. B-Nf7]